MAQSTYVSQDDIAIRVPFSSKHLCTIEPVFQGKLHDQKEIRVISIYNEPMDKGVDLILKRMFFVQYLCLFNPEDFKKATKENINGIAYYIVKQVTNKNSIISMHTHFSAVLKNPVRICIETDLQDAFKLEALGVYTTWPMFRM